MFLSIRDVSKVICFAIYLIFISSCSTAVDEEIASSFKESTLREDKLAQLGKANNNQSVSNGSKPVYALGSGDKLKITIFNEPDLSGEFEVDGSGSVALPLIGNVEVKGLSIRDLEKLLSDKYQEGYLVEPKIGVEILNFRPFFIIGEVNNPGSYPYVNGLTVVNAVAIAGGYTYRAKTDKAIITRGSGENKLELEADNDTIVMPGDSMLILERFF